ncbi:MAG: DUF2007 domain-containing protein [Bacillota bacterium]|nr:DUF2007 domain-containing protein [Bacillota bacterium]
MKDWKLLTIETDPIIATLLEGRLKEEGIPVVTGQEAVGRIYALTTGPLSEIKIFVPNSKFEEARKILEEIENG